MASRATWKGVLKIALVTIPIKVFPATESSATMSFNQLHDACKTRIQQKKWCPTCKCEVATEAIVSGFEFVAGQYVEVLDEEKKAVEPTSTHVIDLTQFADALELEPYAIQRSYYLAPDGPLAAEAFAVMRVAMRGWVGIGKVGMYGREYLAAVRPAVVPASATPQDVLMLHTLHHAAELRSVETIDDLQVVARATDGQVRLAREVIAAFMQPLDLGDFTDDYQVGLRQIVDAKIAGNEIVMPPLADAPPTLPLLEALTQSLATVSAKKTPAKARLSPNRRRAS